MGYVSDFTLTQYCKFPIRMLRLFASFIEEKLYAALKGLGTKAVNVDNTDRGILLDLRRNCRITLQSLSNKHGVSANAIRKRILTLEEMGVIREYVIQLSLAMANIEVLFALIYTDKSIDDDQFAEMVFEHPSITRIHYDSFGTCIALADYSGAIELGEIGTFFRRLESVTDVELHTLPLPRGERRQLSNIELRVLAPLLDNPRMRISEIGRASGLTVKRVRKTLNNLIQGNAVLFTISQDLSASDAQLIAFRIQWDIAQLPPEEIEEKLKEKFPNEFSQVYYSATEPLLWCDFLLGHANMAEKIVAEFRKMPTVDVRNTILVYPPKKTRNIRNQALRKMIADAGIIH